MPQFPSLNTGALAQYPLGRSTSYRTVVTRFVDGTQQRFREMNSPLKRWIVQLEKLNSAEAGVLEEFFYDQQGRSGTFSFTDPVDGIEYPNCVFEEDSHLMLWLSDSDAQSKLIIRTVRA